MDQQQQQTPSPPSGRSERGESSSSSCQQQEQQQQPSLSSPSPVVSESPVEAHPIEAQKRELEVVCRTHGWNHPRTAEMLSTIGLYYQHMERDLESALSCFEQALSILCSHQCNPPPAPGEHDDGSGSSSRGCEVEAAVMLTDMGNVLRCMNRNEDAVRAYQQAMVIFEEKATNRNHPSIQAASRGLALLAVYSSSSTSSSLSSNPRNDEARKRMR